jgi:hypothetical protein
MSSFWQGVRKAAAEGAAKATAAAETAVRRLELQRRVAQLETEQARRFALIGQAVVAAMRAGATMPTGVTIDLASLDAAEAELARLRAEIASLGSTGTPT